jgi:hypothetical protein
MYEFLGWQFSASLSTIFAFFVVTSVSIYLSSRTWKRNGKKRILLPLEVLRTLIVLLILITLLNPEKIKQIKQEEKPNLICLIDESNSMNTRDILDNNGTTISRLDWTRNILSQEWVSQMERNATISIKPFSSKLGKDSTDIGSALEETLQEHTQVKAILLFSDGDSNTGKSLLSLAAKLRGLRTPVYSVQVGNKKALPDLSLEDAFAPTFVLNEEKITIPFRVKNYFEKKKQANISLYVNDQPVLTKPLTLAPSSELSGNLAWLPPQDGNYTLKVLIPTIEGETRSVNNEKTFKTRVENRVIKVLVIDSLPRWEYRFLRNALERDPGVDLKCLLFHPTLPNGSGENYLNAFPKDFDQLAPYDVIFIGDIGIGQGELSEENCDKLTKLVQQQASGMVFLPGRRGRQLSLNDSPLRDLLPVIFDSDKPTGLGMLNPSNLQLTNRGKDHWLTNLRGAGEPDREFWKRLPGFHWSAVVKKSRPGSEVLAVHSNFKNDWGRMPTLVIRYTGAGKTLFLGSDSAWRWRRGVEDKYHYRFWSQVVRWMAHGRYLAKEDGIRLISNPERPKAGDKISLRCIVLDKAGFPLENGEVSASVRHANGLNEKINFQPTPESPGVYLSEIKTQTAGDMSISVETAPFKRGLTLNLTIEKNLKEKTGKPTSGNQLVNLSQLTGGQFSDFKNWESVINQLALLPNPEPMLIINRLRTNQSWGFFLFSLLAIYWTGRKLLGMI